MTIPFTLDPREARLHAALARRMGICIKCERPPVLRTPIERKEYLISAICGPCWDEIFAPIQEG